MLRLTELRLPLDHTAGRAAGRHPPELGIEPRELIGFSIFRRSFDARKRGAIALIYHLDVETARESEILRRLQGRSASGLAGGPDAGHLLSFRRPGAGEDPAARPIVIGIGPCGLFAGLLLAEMGFRPILLERGKQVRERTVDTFGLWRKRDPRIRNPTCSSARAAPAPFPTASSTARSRTPDTAAARCSPNSSRPARRPRSCSSTSPTSAPSGW